MRSRRFSLVGLLGALAFYLLMFTPGAALAMADREEVSKAIKGYLETAERPQSFWIGGEPVYAGKDLMEFYSRRGYEPIWVSENGPTEAAGVLVAALGKAERHGLSSLDYHYACLSEWLKTKVSDRPASTRAMELAGLEIVLSDAFVNFGNHLTNGKVDPVTIYPQWLTEKKRPEVFEFLAGIQTGQDVRETLEALAPISHGYLVAMAEAGRLREVIASGGWPIIRPGKTLRKGDWSPRVTPLRKRLFLDGCLPEAGMENDRVSLFDLDLEKAVAQFQSRRGLSPDGAVGRKTLAALNRSPEDLLETVLVNLERWRWLPRDLGRRHIMINSAAFALEAFQDNQKILEMAIIVGEAYTQTPVFSQDMAYLVINPYWNVPRGVLSRKILPKIKKDPGYLSKNHFELIKGWKEPAALVDPATVDWSTVHAANFPGRLRQRPGPWNALGRIKFIFPNRFSVYLHDTPERDLFQRTIRTFSSGCIRVEKPIDLACFVMENNPSWSRSRIDDILAGGKSTTVPVQDAVTVHLAYLTFWMGEEGKTHYRGDIYDRDRVLLKALRAVPGTRLARPPRTLPEVDPNVAVEPKG
ncbi:MAG: L,D-transpeptidase family protein [Deltaproteobacteria bacterium]|nr:L,D-transpeptidase family protein [Deltaproteobacteria bacterium]